MSQGSGSYRSLVSRSPIIAAVRSHWAVGHRLSMILSEPDAAMRKRLEDRLRHSRRCTRVLDASAEELPLPDDSIDTVVSTLVLCTVDAPDLALRELMRVLRSGGQLRFIEHVRADSPRLVRWQDRLAEPWQRFAVQPRDGSVDGSVWSRTRGRRGVVEGSAANSPAADHRPRFTEGFQATKGLSR